MERRRKEEVGMQSKTRTHTSESGGKKSSIPGPFHFGLLSDGSSGWIWYRFWVLVALVLSASWLSVPCKSGFSPQRPSSWASLGLFREHPCLSKTRCFVQYVLNNQGSSNSPRLRELSLLASRGFGAAFGRLFRCCCPYSEFLWRATS